MLWPTELSERIKTGIDSSMRPYSIALNRLFTHLLFYMDKKYINALFGLVAGVRFELRLRVMGPACCHYTTPAMYIKDIQTLRNSFITTSGIVSTCYSSHLKAFWVRYGFR